MRKGFTPAETTLYLFMNQLQKHYLVSVYEINLEQIKLSLL